MGNNPTAHSRTSASSAERWWNCSGSVREAAKCPEKTPSDDMKNGTAAHKLAEICLKEGSAVSQYVGLELCGRTVTVEMAEAVQVYLDVIDEDLAKHGLTRKDLQIEQRFHLAQVHPDAYGTNDANLQVFLTKVIVYDYKNGAGVAVDAEDNKQGLYYALGAMYEGDYSEAEIVIVQPNAIHKKGPVRRWTVNKQYMDEFAKELRSRITATEDPNAPLCCGPWCTKAFCPALATCPEARSQAQKAAMVVFDKPLEAKNAVPKVENLTMDQLCRILKNADLIDAFIKAAEAYALELANKGTEIPGYKLVARKSNRKWKDEEEVKAKFGLTAVETVVKVLSPSQLETALRLTMKKKEAEAAVAPLTFKPDTGCTLVSVDDPRAAAQPKLEQAFGDESLFS